MGQFHNLDLNWQFFAFWFTFSLIPLGPITVGSGLAAASKICDVT